MNSSQESLVHVKITHELVHVGQRQSNNCIDLKNHTACTTVMHPSRPSAISPQVLFEYCGKFLCKVSYSVNGGGDPLWYRLCRCMKLDRWGLKSAACVLMYFTHHQLLKYLLQSRRR